MSKLTVRMVAMIARASEFPSSPFWTVVTIYVVTNIFKLTVHMMIRHCTHVPFHHVLPCLGHFFFFFWPPSLFPSPVNVSIPGAKAWLCCAAALL